jgi:prepilin-type processing-associated H-X9-DG protein
MWIIGRNGYSEIKCHLGRIKKPSQIMLLGESGHYRISAVETGLLYDPLYPHTGKINLLYCDGHTEARKFLTTVKTEAPWTNADNW